MKMRILALAVALALAGCEGGGSSAPGAAPPSLPPAPAPPPAVPPPPPPPSPPPASDLFTGFWRGVLVRSGGPVDARAESGMAAVGARLVLLGGRGQPRTNILDPQNCTLTKGAAAPSQTHHFQAVTVGQEVYVIGAFTGNFPNETGLPNVRIYNPQTDQWREGPPIPAARQRGAAAAALHEGWIYLAGGIINGHTSGNVAWLDRFNPATGAWEILADAPRTRDHAAAAVIGGKLVLAGGRRTSAANTFGLTVAEVDLYDFAAQTWSTAPNPVPVQRAGVGAVALAQQVLLIGGESTAITAAHADTEAFDPATGAWLRLDPLRQGRHGMGAAVVAGSAYVGSGTPVRGGGQDLANFERFGLTSGPCDP